MAENQEPLDYEHGKNEADHAQSNEKTQEDSGQCLSHEDIQAKGLLGLSDAIKRSEELLAAAKELRAASLKVEKKQEEEDEARRLAKALQEEVNTILSARLDKQDTSQMRSPEKVQKEVLKAHNKVDRAIESANREEEKTEEAYLKLMSLVVVS
jgi:hypothetical protein